MGGESVAEVAVLVVAGVATGLVGYLTGLASLVSYPALLGVGLTPVAANVTNTLALVAIGAGATLRSFTTLLERGRRHLAWQVAISALGGALGGGILLVGGEGSFRQIVPWLIALSSVMLLLSPRVKRMREAGIAAPAWVYPVGLLAISVYGGYFGAGAGTIYLALALMATDEPFGRAMILKSVLLAVTNFVASLLFIAYGPVDWLAAVALGVGCLAGGNLGPLVQRYLPEGLMRWVIALAGLGLALWLSR